MSKQDTIISLLKEIDKNIDNIGGGGAVPKVKVQQLRITDECINDEGRWEGENLIDTSECTSFEEVFYDCSKLTNIDVSNFNTSKVQNMSKMFFKCINLKELDISNFITNNVTSMAYFVRNCNNLETFTANNLDTNSVLSLDAIFTGNINMKVCDVSGWDTSNVINMNVLFCDCQIIKSLDLTSWSANNVANIHIPFYGTKLLSNIVGGKTIDDVLENNITVLNGLKVDLSIKGSIFDRASLRALINGLADLTGQTAQTLTIGETLIAKLTEEDIAIATAKNWTIA